MNLLVLNYEFPPVGGGGAAVCHDLCMKFQQLGHKVTVVTMAYKGLPAHEKVSIGLQIYRIPCLRRKVNVCYPWEQLTYCVSAYFFVLNLMKHTHFDVIHAHFIIPTGLTALWLKRRTGIPYMITAHGSDVIGHNNKRFRYLYKLVKKPWVTILKNGAGITAPSAYLADEIRSNAPGLECNIIPNGIFKERYYASERRKQVIVLARLQESKGIQTVIQAFTDASSREGWTLEILGDGPYKPNLMLLAENLGMTELVHFHGFVTGDELYSHLSEASIFVSASWFEGFSLGVLEAMASQHFVLASDIAPHRQLLPAEQLFGDCKELTMRLEEAMARDNFTVDYDISMYEWDNIVNQYEKLLEEAVTCK